MGKKNTHIHNSRPPHPLLLALVAQFLEQNGFNSSHRIYNTERRKRPKKEGWQGTFGRDYTAEAPSLEAIFQAWQQDASMADGVKAENKSKSKTKINTSSSKTSDGASEDESSSGSSSTSQSSSDSESDVESVVEPRKATPTVTRASGFLTEGASKLLKRKASSSSSGTSSVDGEDDTPENRDSLESQKPTNKRRRVDSSSSSSDDATSDTASDTASDTDSGSLSGQDSVLRKSPVRKSSRGDSLTKSPSSETSSTDDSSSDDASSSDEETTTANQVSAPALSDSSGTVVGDGKGGSSSSESSSSENSTAITEGIVTKKQHTGARPTKLAQISATANADDYISNTYVSYDYADKAYQDLSITRGKGFTKEKNKKKRGSYRGGAIDISGGKGFKFDD